MIRFPKLIATAVLKSLSSGASSPCVFECEDAEDASIGGEYVVKFRSEVTGGPTGLLFEFVAAQLAAHLHIPMPEPALIKIDAGLAEVVQEAEIADRIRASAGLNFGTKFLSAGYGIWQIDDSIPIPLQQIAVEVIAFDAVIDNADRQSRNPNLLWKGDNLFVFDHEKAFAFTRLIGETPEPFAHESMLFLLDHPFYAGLRRRRTIDLSRFIDRLERLRDSNINDILHAVPNTFGKEYREEIRQWLVEVRTRARNIDDALRNIFQ